MSRDPHSAPRFPVTRAFQSGFSIVSAIFLLVVLSALGAMMMNFASVQHTTAAQDVQGSRAYHAARAGIDWGLYQVLRNGAAPACAASTTISPLGGAASGFTVVVQCAAAGADNESGVANINVFTITSTASSGTAASPDRIERQLTVTVEFPVQ